MTLEELKDISRAAEVAENNARYRNDAAKSIAGARNSDATLVKVVYDMRQYDHMQLKSGALEFAEASLRDDLLRLAELRLEAEARALTAKARALRAQLAAYLDQDKPA